MMTKDEKNVEGHPDKSVNAEDVNNSSVFQLDDSQSLMSGAKIEDIADVNDQEEADDKEPSYPQTSPSGEKDSDGEDNSEAREQERIHKKTLKQNKIFKVDLHKIKSILEERIIDQIDPKLDQPKKSKKSNLGNSNQIQ